MGFTAQNSMNSFYTGRGDDGTTGLLGEGRLQKHDLRMETIGTLDEVSAAFGMIRSSVEAQEIKETILFLQKQIYKLMGEVAAAKEVAEKFREINEESVLWVEDRINFFSAQTEIPREFIIPGDSFGGAVIALARTIVRRAERRVSELLSRGDLSNKEILRFLNRLSSLCFVMELFENKKSSKTQQTLVK